MLPGLILAVTVMSSPSLSVVGRDERGAYETMLAKQARDADTRFAGSPCDDAAVATLSTKVVKIPENPRIPVLQEKVSVKGCGRSTVQNITVVRFGGSPPWRMAATLPGDSLADMQLQQGVWPKLVAQAQLDLPANCQDQRVGNAYVVARPGQVDAPLPGAPPPVAAAGHIGLRLPGNLEAEREKLDLTKAWMEVWPLQLCGHDRTTGVIFIPMHGQTSSAYLFLPIWRQIEQRRAVALPAHAPGG
jgi:hypothetical protein